MTTLTPAQQPSEDRDRRPGPYADTLARIAAGDGAALATLYDDFADVVHTLARQQLHRAADAGPITDAVFLEIRYLAAVPPATHRGVLAWILDIAHRRIHDRNHPSPTRTRPPTLLDYDAHTHQELTAFLKAGAAAANRQRSRHG